MIKDEPQQFSIQLHITILEAISMLEQLGSEMEFAIALLRYRPFSVSTVKIPLESANLLADDSGSSIRFELFLTCGEMNPDARDQIEFSDINNDGVNMILCDTRHGKLCESLISGRVHSSKNRALVRAIKKYLKRVMKTGGQYLGVTGIHINDRSHMFSSEAEKLSRNGVKLVQLAGRTQFLPASVSEL